MKQAVHRDFERACHLFQRLNRWNRVTVLNPRDIATEQACPFFDVALRELFRFAQFFQAIADHHDGVLTGQCYLRITKLAQDSSYPGMILSKSNSRYKVE